MRGVNTMDNPKDKIQCDKFSYCPQRMANNLALPCVSDEYYKCRFYQYLKGHREQATGEVDESVWRNWN